jgi:hypothetical protein
VFCLVCAQYGPNCTTWLIAAELIPTETRGMAHGWAAAVGEGFYPILKVSVIVEAASASTDSAQEQLESCMSRCLWRIPLLHLACH